MSWTGRPYHGPPRRDRRRLLRGLVLLIAAALALPVRGSAAAAPSGADELDWLRLMPQTARLYVEFRRLDTIHERLIRLGVWSAITALSDQAEGSAASQAWQRSPDRLLGMSREEAVQTVLSYRTAVIARDPLGWHRGVVLAQLPDAERVEQLLRRWQAQPAESSGAVTRYVFPAAGQIRLARRDTLLLFGPPDDPDGLWEECTRLLGGGAAARFFDRPEARELVDGLPPERDGLIVVSGPAPPNAQTQPGTATTRTAVMAAAVRITDAALRVDAAAVTELPSAVATGPSPARQAVDRPHALLRELPDDTIACWSTRLAADTWPALSGGSGPSMWQSAWRLVDMATAGGAIGANLAGCVGPGVVLCLTRDRETAGDYHIPAVSLLAQAREPPRVAAAFTSLMNVLAAFLNTQVLRAGGGAADLRVEVVSDDPSHIYRLRLGPALSIHTSCPFLHQLELFWCQTPDRFVVSTSLAMVRRVADRAAGSQPAPTGRRPRRFEAFAHAVVADDLPPVHCAFVNGAALSQMMQSWMVYSAKRAPEVFQPTWWRDRFRRREREAEQLGVTLRGQTEDGGSAVVLEVEPGSPAAQVLRPGDVIIAAEGAPLTTSRPAAEIRNHFRQRAADGAFAVQFLRDGRLVSTRIELPRAEAPPLNPVAAMQPFIVLGAQVATLELRVDAPASGRQRARLEARWQQQARPPAGARP